MNLKFGKCSAYVRLAFDYIRLIRRNLLRQLSWFWVVWVRAAPFPFRCFIIYPSDNDWLIQLFGTRFDVQIFFGTVRFCFGKKFGFRAISRLVFSTKLWKRTRPWYRGLLGLLDSRPIQTPEVCVSATLGVPNFVDTGTFLVSPGHVKTK